MPFIDHLIDFFIRSLQNVKQSRKARKKIIWSSRRVKAVKKTPIAAQKHPIKKSVKPAKALTVKPKVKRVVKIPEELIGEVTHYFDKIKVIVVLVSGASLAMGDKIRIVGKTSSFIQTVNSLQIDRKDVPIVKKGKEAGLKVAKEASVGDKVYKVGA